MRPRAEPATCDALDGAYVRVAPAYDEYGDLSVVTLVVVTDGAPRYPAVTRQAVSVRLTPAQARHLGVLCIDRASEPDLLPTPPKENDR